VSLLNPVTFLRKARLPLFAATCSTQLLLLLLLLLQSSLINAACEVCVI
jgi:hypothetical protein